MSKKLLSESQIRRFQGLAGIPALGGNTTPAVREEEDPAEAEQGFDDLDALGDEELELPGDESPEDMGMDMEPSDEGGEIDLSPEQKESLAADIVRAVAQELENALQLDEPIEVEVEAEPALDAELDLDMEEPLDVGEEELEMADEEELTAPPAALEEEAETDDKDDALEESAEEENVHPAADEDIVNEVLRRVLARLTTK